ncbi:hypothetical protein BKA80DRAFT_277662 [Phyllosticta citrichinensis]
MGGWEDGGMEGWRDSPAWFNGSNGQTRPQHTSPHAANPGLTENDVDPSRLHASIVGPGCVSCGESVGAVTASDTGEKRREAD